MSLNDPPRPDRGGNSSASHGSMFGKVTPPYKGNRPAGLQTPVLNDTTHILIALVVIVPIIFTILICLTTYCIYRYHKSRSNRSSADTSNIDQSRPPIATIIYNGQHNPFFSEELPPSYDSLSETKKHPNESIQLTVLPNSTNEVTSASSVIRPTAPTPPPIYANIDEINQK